MPYSDLTDAWNSYDPRYLRVSDVQGLRADPQEDRLRRLDEQEGEGDRRFDERMNYLNKRTNAYGDWTKQAPIDEIMDAGPFGAPRFYTPPMSPLSDYPRDMGYGYGYREGDIMPLPSSRNPGINALIEESMARGDTPLREQGLVDALHGARSGLPRSTSVEDLNNFISGQPISDTNYLATVPTTPSAPNALADDKLISEIAQLMKARDQARAHWGITQQLDTQRKYNYGTFDQTGERDRLAQEDLASRFPSWGGLFDPRPMASAIGRTFDPRPLAGFLGYGLNKLHNTVFTPAY